jgi:hypothetical protein
MKHIESRMLLSGCVLFFALHVAAAADIFSVSPKQGAGASVPYATSSALLAAARSGAIPDLLDKGRLDDIGRSVVAILRDEYHVPTQNLRSDTPFHCGLLLANITAYELKDRQGRRTDEQIAETFQSNRKKLFDGLRNPKFLEAFDSLARDYANVLKETVAQKKELETQRLARDAEKKRQAELAKQQMREEQGKMLAVAVAEAAAKRAEEETRAAVVRQSMEAQAKARMQKLEQILASPAYKLWQVSLQIEEGQRLVESGQKILDYDDAVKRESGVANLTARRTAGEKIVAGKQLFEQAFPVYRQLGGTARTPAEVRAGPDPAREYR